MPDKPLILLGSSRRDLRAFPARARRLAGFQAIYVLHAFEKKSQKTTARDLEIGRDRFRALGKLRQHHGKEERG